MISAFIILYSNREVLISRKLQAPALNELRAPRLKI